MVSASLDREAYLPGENVEVTLRVDNSGDTWVDGVVVHVAGNMPVSNDDMRGFRDGGPGTGEMIGAGQYQSATFWFELPAVLEPVLEFTVLSSAVDSDPSDDRFVLAVPVPGARASLDGVLFADKDRDGTVDAGEGLGGVQMTLYQQRGPWTQLVVRSGSGGRFAIPELVIGDYYLMVGLPAGWKLGLPPSAPYVHVGPGPNTVDVRALRIVKPTLEASVTFDRDTYAVGDVIREHVRITNTGKADIAGITALCTGQGNPNELTADGWGDLASYTGAGVTVRAGETREFNFTDVVPRGGYEYGNVHIFCIFSPDQEDYDHENGVVASAEATVPGGRGDLTGTLYLDEGERGFQDGEGLAGVKMYLVNRAGRIAARTVTDARGRFLFRRAPADNYEIRFVGPWRYVDHPAEYWNVVADQSRGIDLPVAHGPNQPDPDAPPPVPGDDTSTSDDSPLPQARASGVPARLADTGASVRELTGIGIGLLLVGFWLLVLPMRDRRGS